MKTAFVSLKSFKENIFLFPGAHIALKDKP